MIEFIGGGSSGATFSDDRKHRYSLWRRWSTDCPASRMCAFCGLNPSTADESINDPTVSRCINFAKRWGFDGMVMLNIFAFRATDPRDMKRAVDPIGEANDQSLSFCVKACNKSVICCWGVHGEYMNRGKDVASLLSEFNLMCLGETNARHPKHPLYLSSVTESRPWSRYQSTQP